MKPKTFSLFAIHTLLVLGILQVTVTATCDCHGSSQERFKEHKTGCKSSNKGLFLKLFVGSSDGSDLEENYPGDVEEESIEEAACAEKGCVEQSSQSNLNLGIVEVPLIGPFTTILSSLIGFKNSPKTTTRFNTEYDYIVVGAGAAGSVVASRLSEKSCVSVLLLEAGGPPPLLTEVPATPVFFWNTSVDWSYLTTPQKHAGFGLINRQMPFHAGKMLGGSSSINGQLYVRGNKQNFDNWEAAGAKGWNYKEVLRYFKKLEDNKDQEFLLNGYHNVSGPMTVHQTKYESEIKKPLFEGIKEMGYEVVDPNGPRQTGFYDQQAYQRGPKRCSTAKGYLIPAENRPNLHIVTYAMVHKVLFKDKTATGVRFEYKKRIHEVSARREVILSAGAINSAKILLLSGIGPKSELNKFKIPIVADLPVGKNLHDHCGANAVFELGPTIQPVLLKLVNPLNIAQYITTGTGIWSSTVFVSALAFLKEEIARPEEDFPNFELIIAEASAEMGRVMHVRPDVQKQVFAPYTGKPIFTCVANPNQPRSRGTVTLKSTNPCDPPNIDPNYFEHPQDVKDVLDGLKVCRKIGTSKAMRELGSKPIDTIVPGCEQFVTDEDKYLTCTIRTIPLPEWHPVGTARMGNPNDKRTVVDPELKVKNVKNLRVVDASVMPIITSGNTQTPTIMIAEKASDIIKGTIDC